MYISQIFSGECAICLVGFALHFFKNVIRDFRYIKLLFIILIGRIQNIYFRCTRVSAIIAGLLVGIGSGLVLKGDGSNGGFDILGVIFNKYFKISVAVVMNICDCLVLLAQALQKDFMQNVYGLIVIFICAFAVNRVLSYGQSQCEIMIMSKEHIKIKQRIYEEVDAGLTLLHAESGYLSEKMKVIMVVTQYKKIAEVKQIAVSEDPTAFVFVSDVHSVSGKGYTISR